MKKSDIYAAMRKDIEKRAEYMEKYYTKNKKELREYRTKWAADKRRDSLASFTAHGYVHEDGAVEFANVKFYPPRSKK